MENQTVNVNDKEISIQKYRAKKHYKCLSARVTPKTLERWTSWNYWDHGYHNKAHALDIAVSFLINFHEDKLTSGQKERFGLTEERGSSQ